MAPAAETRSPLRPVWIGVAWADLTIVVSSALAVVAFARELDCLFFCTEEENETGAGFVLLLSAAAVVLVSGFVLAARASGWRGLRAVGQGMLGAGALVLVAVALSSLPVVPLVAVLAVGLGGMVSLREPGRTRRVRLVAVGVAALVGVVAGAVSGGFGQLVLVLGTLPLLAVADSVALRRERGAER